MLECISTLSRFRGPQSRRMVAMLRRAGCRQESHDVGRLACYVLDGYAYLVGRRSVLRLDWFELCHVLRQRADRHARRVVMTGGAA